MPDEPQIPERRFNAVKHGCCARSPPLPGEDPALWQQVEDDWFTEYTPETPIARILVGEAALAFWQLARNRNQFQKFELTLSQKQPEDWTNEDHMNYTRFLRYKTAAERSHSNAYKNLEYLRKARMNEAQALRRMENQLHQLQLALVREQSKLERDQEKLALDKQAHAAKTENKPTAAPKASRGKKETFDVAEQWIEVTITDGVTKTDYVPTNDELLDELEDQQCEPKMIYRRLNFPDGIPPEYAWTNLHNPKTCEVNAEGKWCPLCSVQERGGAGIQRMTFQTWLEVIERESQTPGRHAGPTGVGNLPRPKERGGDFDFSELLEMEKFNRENKDGRRP